MELKYHIQACQDAFGHQFSQRALNAIITANTGQDDTHNLLRFNFHFDNNFKDTWGYIDKQRALLFKNLTLEKVTSAWQTFGRITHATQDFYSHSNYVRLWAEKYSENGKLPPPSEINALEPELLDRPDLMTAKIYMPFEMITYWERFRPFARRHLPQDSHANMHLDHPGRGPLFPYAQAAAAQRLRYDYQDITEEMTPDQLRIFTDLDNRD